MVAMNNRERCLGMGGRLGVEKKVVLFGGWGSVQMFISRAVLVV
jgi:hypothetical protein